MGELILVTGGSRSGKSDYALSLAESLSPAGERTFLATAPVLDEEMKARIKRHRQDRVGRGWDTIEEPYDPATLITQAQAGNVILLDCLTLWVNNRMYRAEQAGEVCGEDDIVAACGRLLRACIERSGPVVLVTNEVGFSIVPENPLARRYRDLVGRCNQTIASRADRVVLVCCGCPLTMKG